MNWILATVGGLAVLAAVGQWFVAPVISRAAVKPAKPEIIPATVWAELTGGADGGDWVGHLERSLAFVAFTLGIESLVAAWFAFKLASKWEVWKNVIRLPHSPTAESQFDWLAWTHAYGSWILQRFWVGTLLNVLLALLVSLGARHAYRLLN